jgi:hypothetical protein
MRVDSVAQLIILPLQGGICITYVTSMQSASSSRLKLNNFFPIRDYSGMQVFLMNMQKPYYASYPYILHP